MSGLIASLKSAPRPNCQSRSAMTAARVRVLRSCHLFCLFGSSKLVYRPNVGTLPSPRHRLPMPSVKSCAPCAEVRSDLGSGHWLRFINVADVPLAEVHVAASALLHRLIVPGFPAQPLRSFLDRTQMVKSTQPRLIRASPPRIALARRSASCDGGIHRSDPCPSTKGADLCRGDP